MFNAYFKPRCQRTEDMCNLCKERSELLALNIVQMISSAREIDHVEDATQL